MFSNWILIPANKKAMIRLNIFRLCFVARSNGTDPKHACVTNELNDTSVVRFFYLHLTVHLCAFIIHGHQPMGTLLKTLYQHMENLLKTLYQHMGTLLKTLYQHMGTLLKTLYQHMGTLLKTLYQHMGTLLKTLYQHMGTLLNTLYQHMGFLLNTLCHLDHSSNLKLPKRNVESTNSYPSVILPFFTYKKRSLETLSALLESLEVLKSVLQLPWRISCILSLRLPPC